MKDETKITEVRDIIANADKRLLFEALFHGCFIMPMPFSKTFIIHIAVSKSEKDRETMQKFADMMFPNEYQIN